MHYLSDFLNKSSSDKLNPYHISLYLAIHHVWYCNNRLNPVSISRNHIMKLSKINSTATYHKCLKELITKGYIGYNPTFNPHKNSQIHLLLLTQNP